MNENLSRSQNAPQDGIPSFATRGSIVHAIISHPLGSATILFLLAVIVVFLGHWADANGLKLIIASRFADPEGSETLRVDDTVHVYGYLAELSHGLFYLLIAPVFVYISCKFQVTASESFENLPVEQRTEMRARRSLRSYIKREAHGLSSAALVALVCVIITLTGYDEYRTFEAELKNTSHTLGYVQRPFVQEYTNAFNRVDPSKIWSSLPSKTLRQSLQTNLIAALAVHGVPSSNIWPFLVLERARMTNSVAGIIQSEISAGRVSIDGEGITQAKLVTLRAYIRTGKPAPPTSAMHLVFVVAVVVVEGIFIGFTVWTFFRTALWLTLVYRLIPGVKTHCSYMFHLNHKDDVNYRFGLRELDDCYNAYVVLILIGSFAVVLNYFSNFEKGTTVLGNQGIQLYFTPVLLLLLVLAPLLTLVLGPMYLFGKHLQQETVIELDRLNKLKKATPLSDDVKRREIDKDIETCKNQRPWPQRSKKFLAIFWLSVAVLVTPALTETTDWVPEKVKKVLSVVRISKDVTAAICEWMYKL